MTPHQLEIPLLTVDALELFAGAGGWSLAAEALGIAAEGVENMPAARATRDAAGLRTIWDDVWTIPRRIPRGVRGHIASPPCPSFSAAGNGSGRAAMPDILRTVPLVGDMPLENLRAMTAQFGGDERTTLVLTPLWYALRYEPEWICWEQVPRVLPVWEACAAELRDRGYSTWTGYLHAEQYDVPQTRKRAFLIASRRHIVDAPAPTRSRYHSHAPARLDRGVPSWISMAQALGYGLRSRPAPTVTGGGTSTGGAEPIAHLHRYLNGPDWTPNPAIDGETPADCAWVYDRPSPTIVGTFQPDVVAAPGYRKAGDPPRQRTPGSVRVSVAEAGVLQGFPPDFPWQGTEGKQYLQAGNAVPPPLALRVLAAASGAPG